MDPLENARIVARDRDEKKIVVSGLPTDLTIESTSICNLRCVMCPHSIGEVPRPKHMPEQLLIKLEKAIGQASKIQLHGIGEPMISPTFWRILEEVPFHPEADVFINSNMTLLDDHKIKVLTGLPVKLTINISLDAARPQTYRRIRGGDLNRVLSNIEALRHARKGSYPNLWINMTLMRENIEEVVEFIELAHRLGTEAVCIWHLNRIPDADMARLRSTRGDWHFDYVSQGLWNFKSLSNQWIRSAIERAKELNVNLRLDASKIVFYDLDDAEAKPR